MKIISFVALLLLGISFVISFIALFLTLRAPVGLSSQNRIQLNNLANEITQMATLSAQNTHSLQEATTVNNNVTINPFLLPRLQACQSANRVAIGPVVQLAQTRLAQLILFNTTLNFTSLAVSLNVSMDATTTLYGLMGGTGVITTHGSGTTLPPTTAWNYTLQGFTLATGREIYFLSFPAGQKAFFAINGTNTIQLDMGTSFWASVGSGQDSILDDQTHKLDNAPNFIRFLRRVYSGSSIVLVGDTPFTTENFVQIIQNLELQL